jgi:uncharacterized protein YjbJ (UPF0337 family)
MFEIDSAGDARNMSNSNIDETKGRIKEAAGDLTDNDDLKREGKTDQAVADVKKGVEKVADKASDAVDSVKDKLTND